MNKMIAGISAICVSLVLTGCAAAPPVHEDNFYRLSHVAQETTTTSLFSGATIEVARFVADGSVSNRPLLYTTEDNPNAVSEYHYHFWIEAPPTLIKDALVSYLRASAIAKRVVTPEMRVEADYSVLGRIKRLEVSNGTNYSGVVAFEMGLRRNSDGELLVLEEYEATVPASANNVGAAITAVQQATEEVFKRFMQDIQAR